MEVAVEMAIDEVGAREAVRIDQLAVGLATDAADRKPKNEPIAIDRLACAELRTEGTRKAYLLPSLALKWERMIL